MFFPRCYSFDSDSFGAIVSMRDLEFLCLKMGSSIPTKTNKIYNHICLNWNDDDMIACAVAVCSAIIEIANDISEFLMGNVSHSCSFGFLSLCVKFYHISIPHRVLCNRSDFDSESVFMIIMNHTIFDGIDLKVVIAISLWAMCLRKCNKQPPKIAHVVFYRRKISSTGQKKRRYYEWKCLLISLL